ncbi:hypothetical protein ANO11243_079820 [Dothideomycetidae sp. 11243]|nr:hypothetical protein ANO11243_079820 [fungal sp. No.11243]
MKQFTVLATLFALWASASAAPNAEPEPFLGVHFGSQWLKGGVCTKGAGSDPGYCVLPVGATPTTDGAATDGSATQPQKRDDTHYPCTNMHPNRKTVEGGSGTPCGGGEAFPPYVPLPHHRPEADSIAQVFDNALRLTFARFQSLHKFKSRTLDRKIGKPADPDGQMHSEILFGQGYHYVHTVFRIWGRTEKEVWSNLKQYRRYETAEQPCPHISRGNVPCLGIFFAADHSFSQFQGDTRALGLTEARAPQQPAAEKVARIHHCSVCATSISAVFSRTRDHSQRKFSLELHAWHILGFLSSPLDPHWLRLAAVKHDALVVPRPGYGDSTDVRNRFLIAKGRQTHLEGASTIS